MSDGPAAKKRAFDQQLQQTGEVNLLQQLGDALPRQPQPPTDLSSLLQDAEGQPAAAGAGLTAELADTFLPLLGSSLGDGEVSSSGLVVVVGWSMPRCCYNRIVSTSSR